MAHLGLERHKSHWTACVFDQDGLPQEIAVPDVDAPAGLASCLPTQKWEAVVLSLPSDEVRDEHTAHALQHQLQETLGVENVRLISRPVAVAICATWSAASGADTTPSFPMVQGQDLLVCDFREDESTATLVRRGPDELPLVVQERCTFRLSGERMDSHLFEVLSQLLSWTEDSISKATRTRALQSVAELRRTISRNLDRAKPGRKIIAAKATWADDQGTEHIVVLSPELYLTTLEPLFVSARAELEAFLRTQPQLPAAVMLSGEAALTFGVRQHLLEPVLRVIYGDEVATRLISDPWVLTSFSQNAGVVGAALVGVSKVSYQELLPCDIGVRLRVEANGALARLLQLPPDTQEFWLYPLLLRGASLPAQFNSTDVDLFHLLDLGEHLDWDVRWELDGQATRYCQPFPEWHDKEKPVVVEWRLEADASGTVRTSFDGHRRIVQEIALFDCARAIVTPIRHIPSVSLARLQELLASAENWH